MTTSRPRRLLPADPRRPRGRPAPARRRPPPTPGLPRRPDQRVRHRQAPQPGQERDGGVIEIDPPGDPRPAIGEGFSGIKTRFPEPLASISFPSAYGPDRNTWCRGDRIRPRTRRRRRRDSKLYRVQSFGPIGTKLETMKARYVGKSTSAKRADYTVHPRRAFGHPASIGRPGGRRARAVELDAGQSGMRGRMGPDQSALVILAEIAAAGSRLSGHRSRGKAITARRDRFESSALAVSPLDVRGGSKAGLMVRP